MIFRTFQTTANSSCAASSTKQRHNSPCLLEVNISMSHCQHVTVYCLLSDPETFSWQCHSKHYHL